ncbi:NUMOD4 domain-containing protein [Neobacillus mesonae]|nr:NUMOD4 domain-containing protein [Neobacillus mesonae]
MEHWVDIVGYEGKYQVSNQGRVRSLDREIITKNGVVKPKKGKVLSPCNNGNGYMYVSLGKGNHEYIHHLVARAFVCNPRCVKEVNHINEIKSDNRADNLEWVTRIENIRHGTGIERARRARAGKLINGKCSKPVIGVHESDNTVIEFPSIAEATRHGYDAGMVIKCCRGEKKKYRGYRFKYA